MNSLQLRELIAPFIPDGTVIRHMPDNSLLLTKTYLIGSKKDLSNTWTCCRSGWVSVHNTILSLKLFQGEEGGSLEIDLADPQSLDTFKEELHRVLRR